MRRIEAKLSRDERLRSADARYLLSDAPLLELGALANELRFRRHAQPLVTYVVDTNLNYTNICDAYCQFCAFYRPHTVPGPDAYTHSIDEMLDKMAAAVAMGCTTVLMQGGLNPDLPFDYYLDMVSATRERFPDLTPHFWSAPEVYKMSEVSGLDYNQVMRALYEAGQRTFPGGGAEVLSNRARREISPLKMDADEWIAVHRAAHDAGIRSSATMMYGHVESLDDLVEHFDRVRDLQDATGGFTAFIPWSFAPGSTHLGRKLKSKRADANQYLRIIAAARVYLDNFEHVDASWFSEGKKTGEVALHFGADDFGGTLFEENVMQEAGHYVRTTIAETQTMIREAGFVPAQRNTLYEVQRVFDAAPIAV